MNGQMKFHKPFDFYNICKFIFSTNKLPLSFDLSEAFFRRWILVELDRVFSGERDIIEEFNTPEKKSGMLNYFLEGLRTLKENNYRFTNMPSIEEVKAKYTRLSDTVMAFINTFLENKPKTVITPQNAIYSRYEDYCRSIKEEPLDTRLFFKYLYKHIECKQERPRLPNKKRINVLRGVGFKGEDSPNILTEPEDKAQSTLKGGIHKPPS